MDPVREVFALVGDLLLAFGEQQKGASAKEGQLKADKRSARGRT